MADQKFLNWLDQMQQDYIPCPEPITPDFLHKVETVFKIIGGYVQRPNPHGMHDAMLSNLWLIACFALDGLQSNDYAKLFESIRDLHARKNKGYAGVGAVDHWANFRMAEWFGVSSFTGCLIRMTDKFIRVRNLSKNPEADQVGEAITDTLYDLAIYALIAICLWEEEKARHDAIGEVTSEPHAT